MGGSLGSSIGMAAGGLLGTWMGGGQVKGADVAKTALGLAGGAIAGKSGSMIGKALGGLVGGGEGGGGEAGEAGGGATTVGGGDVGDMAQAFRLLKEISMNIQSLVSDGVAIRRGHSAGAI